MRKFIVRNFEFSTHVTLFGKTFVSLRASRILFPLFVLCGIVIVGDPTTYTFYWFHVIAYVLLAIGIWLGFNFFNVGYFGTAPVFYHELDREQKWFAFQVYRKGVIKNDHPLAKHFLSIPPTILAVEYSLLKDEMEKRYYTKRFAGLKSLIGLWVGIGSLIINYIYWL